MKYVIKSNLLQNGKWQPAYLPPPIILNGQADFSEGTEFDKKFNTKEESDDFVFDYLIKKGIPKNKIETQDR